MWLLLSVLVLGVTSVAISSPVLPRGCVPDLPCIPKCCPEGHGLYEDRDCHFDNSSFRIKLGENATSYAEPHQYVLVYGNPCKGGKFPLNPDDDEADFNYFLANGSLMVPAQYYEALGPTDFCLETLHEDDIVITTPFLCFPDDVNKAERSTTLHFIIYPVGLLISVPFLVLTVVVYCLIPNLGDLNGKALCCYCSCLAIAYFFLACVQLGGTTFSDHLCSGLAFLIQFFFVACFFWLNVLCIDTFWCIMAVTGIVSVYPGLPQWKWQSSKNVWMVIDEEIDDKWHKMFIRKVFVAYSVYAWCLPLILLAIVIFMDLHPTIPSSYVKPQMGYSKCWFSSDEAALQYFYAPIATLLLINLALFVITMYRLLRFNWNPNGPHRTPKQKARMCLMLFLAMGVSWIFEIVSWAVGGPHYVWVMTDAFNILQGVVIFCIYVLEPRVKYLVLTRLWEPLRVKLGRYKCCGRQLVSESTLPSPLPEENNTMLTVLENSFEMHSRVMNR